MSSKKTTTRRCSLCRKTGHTKRTCSFDFKANTIKKGTSFIRVQQEKKESHPKQGGYNPEDVSVDKIFYFGNKK